MQKKDKHHKDDKNQEQQQNAADAEHAAAHGSTEQQDNEDKQETKEADQLTVQLETTRNEVKALQVQLEEANDKFLRLFSEFDNYRKRVTRERIELSKTAAESVISALLPVLDDLERASKNAVQEQGTDAADKGVVLIYNKFKSILKQKGVEEIPAEGEEFSTDFHEAITHVPAESEEEKGKVREEVQKGYLLNGKVIRHSRVVVAN